MISIIIRNFQTSNGSVFLKPSCTAVYEKSPSLQLAPKRLLRPPSMHIVVASTGTRPQIYGLIASLQDLVETDYLTVIIDGGHDRDSTVGSLNLSGLENYVTNMLKCQVGDVSQCLYTCMYYVRNYVLYVLYVYMYVVSQVHIIFH